MSNSLDHEAVFLQRGAMSRVLCRCGWQSEWRSSQDDAEAEHELHEALVLAPTACAR